MLATATLHGLPYISGVCYVRLGSDPSLYAPSALLGGRSDPLEQQEVPAPPPHHRWCGMHSARPAPRAAQYLSARSRSFAITAKRLTR